MIPFFPAQFKRNLEALPYRLIVRAAVFFLPLRPNTCRFGRKNQLFLQSLLPSIWLFAKRMPKIFGYFYLWNASACDKIPSLTVRKRKNRCIPHVYWGIAIFVVVSKYSNLFLPFTFFLNISHLTFCYELIICSETADVMKIIRNSFSFV